MNPFKRNEPDNIYYNVKIDGVGERENTARFSETRVQAVLENPTEYELAVVRFSVPSRIVPIMFFRDGNPANGYTPEQRYTVTMSFDGVDETIQLSHIITELPKPLYGQPTIWTYASFIQSLNQALIECFANLKALKPAAPPTAPPFMSYFQTSERFSLYAPIEYDTDGPPTIDLYFNPELERLFDSMQIIYNRDEPDAKRFKYIIRSNNLNLTTHLGNPYYIMYQDSTSLFLWNEIQSLQFETNSIPVNPEYLSSQKNIIRRVITDFEPASNAPSAQVIQYFPQGPLRFYDLNSSYPLKQIDLNVSWIDRKGITRPIYVREEDPLTVKLRFRKKKLTIHVANDDELE
jgi:hypothetical protein